MLRSLILAATHLVALAIGIATGIYALPMLTEPNPPHESELRTTRTDLLYMGRFQRNLKGSDFVHWGDGEVRILKNRIAHEGRIAPGPKTTSCILHLTLLKQKTPSSTSSICHGALAT